MLNCSKLLMGK